MSSHWEKKACVKCGYTRRVRVWEWTKPTWNELCSICDLERRARVHEYWARKFRERAAAQRAKRTKGVP